MKKENIFLLQLNHDMNEILRNKLKLLFLIEWLQFGEYIELLIKRPNYKYLKNYDWL